MLRENNNMDLSLKSKIIKQIVVIGPGVCFTRHFTHGIRRAFVFFLEEDKKDKHRT